MIAKAVYNQYMLGVASPFAYQPRSISLSILSTWMLLFLGAACASSGKQTLRSKHGGDVPVRVQTQNLGEAMRVYHALPQDHKSRASLRASILAVLATKIPRGTSKEDYKRSIVVFGKMTRLYSGSELASGNLAKELRIPARKISELGARIGDEARVLAALLVLSKIKNNDDTKKAKREYAELAQWGKQVRADMGDPIRRLTSLIQVWESHARLTPTPEVLGYVSKLHIARRDVARQRLQGSEGFLSPPDAMWQNGRPSTLSAIMLRAPLDIASLYLREGNVRGAAKALRSFPKPSKRDRDVHDVIHAAGQDSEDGLQSLYELAETFRPTRPDVALGVCREGIRKNPGDLRFPVCLARIASEQDRFADSAAWYLQAIRIAPDEQGLYDESLSTLNHLIERGLLRPNFGEAGFLVSVTETILKGRQERWPGSPSPVTEDQLQLLLGTLEMNAGRLESAKKKLEASVRLKKTEAAFMQLGTLALRTGAYDRAIYYLKKSVALMPPHKTSMLSKRAEALEQLGDALRQTGRKREAQLAYEQALSAWKELGTGVTGTGMAAVHLRQGILLDRLDRHSEAVAVFRQAMTVASTWQEAYASILSHLVVTAPDRDLAHEVFRRAQRHITLEPEWKVYFALWVTTVSGRAGSEPDEDVQEMLETLGSGAPWWGNLARFGSGKLPYQELVSKASGVGQQTEAYFYEATRRLNRGDRVGAEKLFQRVLSTHMVNFYEFAMAQELLGKSKKTGSLDRLPVSAK